MQVVVSVLVLGIFFTIFIISDTRSYKQRKVEDTITLAQVIGSNTVSALQFLDEEAARNILMELHKVNPDIFQAGILDKDGNVFVHYSKPGSDSPDVFTLLKNKNSLFRENHLYVKSDILNGNELLGKIFLEADLAELRQLNKSKFESAALLLLLALGFSVFLAMIMQTYISRRLLSLVNTMKEVARTGDYSKQIADDGKDEISVLVQGFDQLMEKIKENLRRKDEFIGIASHELKTPLTSLKGYLELLKQIEDHSLSRKFSEKALNSVSKLEKLIRDLLDVSKIQGGQLELNPIEFDMGNLVDESIASVQLFSNTHIIIREDDLKNTMIVADRQRIDQVLVNLLTNAIKYSPGEKKVIVRSKVAKDELVIQIRDYGTGVSSEEQHLIFDRFYRTRNTSVHISGFGLGLYICRDIITRHGGRIWVQAEEKGSTFSFTLPLHKLAAKQQTLLNLSNEQNFSSR